MNISKLQDAIAELDAEAGRCKRLADELRIVVQRSTSGNLAAAKAPVIQPRRQRQLPLNGSEQKSVRTLAVEILASNGKPMHINDLLPLINAQRKDETNRAAVESQLVRAIKIGTLGVKRTAPGTFAVER